MVSSQIDHIKKKLGQVKGQGLRSFGDEAHGFKSAPLPSREVQKWELVHGVQLPEQYRKFLTEIGPGTGPYYGIFPLTRWGEFIGGLFDDGVDASSCSRGVPKDALSAPNEFVPGPNQVDEELAFDEVHCPYKGLIAIGHQGCTGYVLLVVSGPNAGRVVYSDLDQLNAYMCRDETFLDWYERWLDEMLEGMDVTWFGFVPGGTEAQLWGMFRADDADEKLKQEVVFAFRGRNRLSDETLDELEKLASHSGLQVQVLSTLGKHAPGRVQALALSLIQHCDTSLRLAAVRALDLDEVGADPLIPLVFEEESDVALAAFFRIETAGLMDPSLRRQIIMTAKSPSARSQAAWKYGFSADDADVILSCLRGPSFGVILSGISHVRLLDPEVALRELERVLEVEVENREGAIRAVGRLDHPRAGDLIFRFLDDEDDFVRLATLEALAELGDERLKVSAKRMLKEDRIPIVRTKSGSRSHSKTIAQLTKEVLKRHGFWVLWGVMLLISCAAQPTEVESQLCGYALGKAMEREMGDPEPMNCEVFGDVRRKSKNLDSALPEYLKNTHVLTERPEDFRLQILISELLEVDGVPCLVEHGYRVDAEYFYPASAIKSVASVTALRVADGMGVGLDDELVFGGTSKSPRSTLRGLVEETQIVSSNEAFNRLYEFSGHDLMNGWMWNLGLTSLQMQHRMFSKATPDEERIVPEVQVCQGEPCVLRPLFPERRSDWTWSKTTASGLQVGTSYRDLITGDLIEGPMDFSTKNIFSLRDHQRLMIGLIRPGLGGAPDFRLSKQARDLLIQSMERDPTSYRPSLGEGALQRFKPMSPGLGEVEGLRYLNKAGRALGFHVENAILVKGELAEPERMVFVTAAIYVNKNGRLNDDTYEYQTLSFPFFEELGRLVAAEFLTGAD